MGTWHAMSLEWRNVALTASTHSIRCVLAHRHFYPGPCPAARPLLHMAHCSVAACGGAALRSSSSISSINSSSSSSRRVAAASSSGGGGRRRGGGRLVVTAKVDLQGAPRIIRGKCFVTKDVSGSWRLEGGEILSYALIAGSRSGATACAQVPPQLPLPN